MRAEGYRVIVKKKKMIISGVYRQIVYTLVQCVGRVLAAVQQCIVRVEDGYTIDVVISKAT